MPAAGMIDPNNRPGGPNLIVTAKTANKIQFFDVASLALRGEIVMPASPYEMARSLDGATIYASIYCGGVFRNNANHDHRIAVIDLATKSLKRILDVGGNFAPHSLMMDKGGTLWASAELADAVLAIDPMSGGVERVALDGAPHWLAIRHATGKLFASLARRWRWSISNSEKQSTSSPSPKAPRASLSRPMVMRSMSAPTGAVK